MNKAKNLATSQSFISCMASFLSILFGLLFGLLLLFVFHSEFALRGFSKMVTTGIGSLDKLAKVLYQAAPLIMTGLSVGFAFKTGLFNIGATGQYTIGAFCALTAAIQFQMPWYIGLLAAMVGGALWGAIPGICKAFFNVNEVITAIMFNWIGMFLVNLLISNMPKMIANYWAGPQSDRTASLAVANPSGMIPKAGLDQLMGSNYMNISIFLVILIAVIAYLVLQKTTFGYELKACGYNRNASEYAGINAKKNIILSMVISGAFAGIGGGIYYLSGTAQYNLVKSLLAAGFNGIPVALLASSNPIGTIFSGLFISYIQVGGDAMQPEFAKETIDIIISVIIYLSAFSLLIQEMIRKFIKTDSGNVNAEPADSFSNQNKQEQEKAEKSEQKNGSGQKSGQMQKNGKDRK